MIPGSGSFPAGAVGGPRPTPPSGEQYAIAYGDYRAEITQVGAGLRECLYQGKAVLDGFEVNDRAPDGRGQVLVPWPNRLADGRYEFLGRGCEAPLNEPERHNAIHGLVRWLEWTPVSHSPSAVSLTCTLHPQPGYEWQLRLEVTYGLAEDGLIVKTQIENQSLEPAPVGVGFHPYLTLGRTIDDLDLHLPACGYLLPATSPDSEPVTIPVQGTAMDFARSTRVGTTALDTAFTELSRDAEGRATAELRDPVADQSIKLWVDEAYGYLMVYTGDGVTDPARRRRAVAIEPMTCPPNAFRSGVAVICLDPQEVWQGCWGVRAGIGTSTPRPVR